MVEHYYSKEQSSPLRLSKIQVSVAGLEFELLGGSGTFAAKKLDKGSALLIKYAVVPPKSKVLDLGCGNGVVGICMIKLYDAQVTFTDVNKRAVKVTKMNLKELGLEKQSTVFDGDKYEHVKGTFDVILLNPPQTAGKDVCFDMITESKQYLNKNGTLQIVARHQKGGKALSEKMKETFGNVEELAKGSGFRVYLSKK